MVTYDKDEAARLVAELREDDTRMTPTPWVRGEHEDHIGGDADDPEGPCHIVTTEGQAMIADAGGLIRLRNSAPVLADQLEAAMAEIERLNAKLNEPILDIIRERDRFRTELVQLRRELLPDHVAGRFDACLVEKRKRKAAQAEIACMRPVVEAAVLVAELDELCDRHPGNDDPAGRKAEAALYEAVRARTHAVDDYRAGKP
jgi:hypothetical protein